VRYRSGGAASWATCGAVSAVVADGEATRVIAAVVVVVVALVGTRL